MKEDMHPSSSTDASIYQLKTTLDNSEINEEKKEKQNGAMIGKMVKICWVNKTVSSRLMCKAE